MAGPLALALQYAPAAISGLSGLYGMFSNPYNKQKEFKAGAAPGEDEFYKSVERMAQAIKPQQLNASAAMTDSINQSVSDQRRAAMSSMAGGVGSMGNKRLEDAGAQAQTRGRAELASQFAGRAIEGGQVGYQSKMNQYIADLQNARYAHEDNLARQLGKTDFRNQSLGAISGAFDLANTVMEGQSGLDELKKRAETDPKFAEQMIELGLGPLLGLTGAGE